MAVLTEELTPEHLKWLGQHLDDIWPKGEKAGPTERDHFIETYLKIRTKTASRASFELNRAQRAYSTKCDKQNIVLKARQLGITTYIAARFFVQTITQDGILSMQVTHDRQSAQDIFRIVRRFWQNLPDEFAKATCKPRVATCGSWCLRIWIASIVWLRPRRMPVEAARFSICIVLRFRAGVGKATRL